MAQKLSEKLKIPWISTDTIRGLMREIVSDKKYPDLFKSRNAKAEIYLKTKTPKQIVKEQNEESKEVWKGVLGFIKSNYVWDSYIIEGVAILPSFFFKSFQNDESMKIIFLLNDNEKKIRDIVHLRGLWDDADKYPDSVKDLEVKWVLEFNCWLFSEVKKYKMPFVFFDEKKLEQNILKKIKI